MNCCTFTDCNDSQNKYCMLQYYFNGPEININIKPHGNAKSDAPFFRTAHSARKLHREISTKAKPKEAIFSATEQQGGEVQARGMSSLPRNHQQISNYQRVEHKKDHNVLYSVMLECKLAQGSQELFVRDVKAAPDPQCVLSFDWHLQDMERFLTQPEEFGILTIDTTYNLGQFYVTPTTYPHLMLEDISTRKHPVMLGPVLVHQRMDFATFNYFASTLVGLNKTLRNVRAFGTDGQESMIEAFGHSFPHAMHLSCFTHFKKNSIEKLKEYGIPSQVSDEFVADIFGKRSGSMYEEDLVDATSPYDFDTRLESCREIWNTREAPYTPSSGPRFHTYFVRYKASAVCYNMRKDLREAAGLGSPAGTFTTNASESVNAAIKRKVEYKESEWPTFNDKIKQLAKQQREEVIRSLSSRGQYRLLPQYLHFGVPTTKWGKMKPDQRSHIVNKFDMATVKSKSSIPMLPLPPSTASQSSTPNTSCISLCGPTSNNRVHLSISAEAGVLTKLSLATVQGIWEKAEELLSTTNAITVAPGSSLKARMVLSYSSVVPHLVREVSSGRYECDEKCLNWSSSGICSHSVAVAVLNIDLHSFLQWYNTSTVEPNINSLAMAGLPSGRGRKGGVPKRKRSQSKNVTIESVRQRSAILPSVPSSVSSHHIGTSPVSSHSTFVSSAPPATLQLRFSTVVSQTATTSPITMSVPSSIAACMQTFNIQQPVNIGLSFANQSTTYVSSASPPGVTHSFSVPNINPFFLRLLGGNIRVCQGCRGSLRMKDQSIPSPPFNLVIARAERRQFRDSSGELISPRAEQNVHYHLNIQCVRAVEPMFVPQSLKVPSDIVPLLTTVHQEFLRLVFQVPGLE